VSLILVNIGMGMRVAIFTHVRVIVVFIARGSLWAEYGVGDLADAAFELVLNDMAVPNRKV
jgi:hypothetical protein